MTEFNYDQFPTPTLQAELSRVQDTLAALNEKHSIIVRTLAIRAMDSTIQLPPQADDVV